MLTCTIVPRVTGLVFVARVMTPAIVFRDCLDNTSCSHSVSRAYAPPSAESSKDTSNLQLVRCFCRHRASWSVGTSRQASIDRSAKLVEPSLGLVSLLRHGDTCAHTLRCCAHVTSYSCLWNPKLHCKAAPGRPVLASCPVAIWPLSSRTSTLAVNSWLATFFTVEDQPPT